MTQITEVRDDSELQKEFDKVLKKLSKVLNGPYITKIGVLGSSSSRPESDIDNAGLGLVHEFGSLKRNIPPRSWLRMPIINRIKMILQAVSNKQRSIEHAFQIGDDQAIFEILGLACESAIQEAFDTNGFGSWQAKKDPKDGKTSPLIDTGEFRQSVISSVQRK